MNDIVEGHCRCGRVRMKVTGPPLLTMACHCTGCQHMTGSAFSASALVLAANFEVSGDEPVVGGLHGPTRHYFCPSCMSWLFTRPEGMDEIVNLRSTLFEALADEPPFIEAWTSERRAWATTGAAHGFPQLPEMSELPELMKAFAEQRSDTRD